MSQHPDAEATLKAFVDHLFGGVPRRHQDRRDPTIQAVLWRGGCCISAPTGAVPDPPPPVLIVRQPRVFGSLYELVAYMTGDDPETEEYVLQYVKPEPRIAVYLYAPEALALMDSA